MDEGSCHNPDQAKKLAIAAIFVIWVCSSAGVALPIYGRRFVKSLQPGSNLFILGKALGAGIILGLAFTHVLNDATEDLTNECLTGKWTVYPWSFWIASMGVALSLALELVAVQVHAWISGQNSLLALANGHHHPDHVHVHGLAHQGVAPSVDSGDAHPPAGSVKSLDVEAGSVAKESTFGTPRHKIIAEVLEIGIIVHSVLVGIGLGTNTSKCTVTSLFIALCFHQFFEGVALGSCIVEAAYKSLTTFLMAFFFAITTPLGIAIGLGVRSSYNDNSPEALGIEGTFNAFTAGILIYMATVDLIAHDFFSAKVLGNPKLLWGCFLAVLLGMGTMDLLAYWA
ncbi:Fe2+/Zn2+ regulated transporter [Klebsormidium nitens]|uniref:Fe2+/Zn2+ regulated transporter n=1 Tax=Klebsormidium nitens TaxID=105231 RepID=A0A1Y1HRS9_KLENI|nr:Fe2+/Zn2+ regulated transporter [Klebsormidium nitens]|eukprot:GAQ79869.1 Fe2+/Zn2+ regulated transporter [Klebsormidium nitens]